MMQERSDEELTSAIEQEIASGEFQRGLTRVVNRVRTAPRAVYSVRLTAEEVREFETAAKERKQTLSEFLRAAAHAYLETDRSGAVAEARRKARELTDVLSRI